MLRGISRVVDQDVLSNDEYADCMGEELAVKPAISYKLHQIQRRQIACRVIKEHVLRARIRRIDPIALRAGMPGVDRRIELHAGISAEPGLLGDLAQDGCRADPFDWAACRPRQEGPTFTLALLRKLHELVRNANRVVGVLIEDRRVSL